MIYLTPRFAALLACAASIVHAGVLRQAEGQQVAFQHAPVQSTAARAVGIALDSAADGHRWTSGGAFASAFRHSRVRRRSKHPKDDDDDSSDDMKHRKPPKKVTAPLPDSFVHKSQGKPKHTPGAHHHDDDGDSSSDDADESKRPSRDRPKHHGKDKRGHSHVFYDVPIRVRGHGRHNTLVVDGPILIGGRGHYLHRAWKRFSRRTLDRGLWNRTPLAKRRHTDVIIEKVSGHHHPHVSDVTVVHGIRRRKREHIRRRSLFAAQGVLGAPEAQTLAKRRRPDVIITRPETIVYEDDHDHGHYHGHSHSHSHRSALERRDDPAPVAPVPDDEVPGSIDIISYVYNSPIGKKIASLVLSTEQSSNNSFVLNASNTTVTQIYLKAVANAPALADGFSRTVNLLVRVFSPSQAALVFFCATFDPNPPAPAPLTAKPCTGNVTAHSSQLFAYNPENGVIRPLWMVDAADVPDTPSASNFDAKALDSVELGPSPSSATAPVPSSAPDTPLSAPQNVTMVFTPATHAILQNVPVPPNKNVTTQLPASSVGAKSAESTSMSASMSTPSSASSMVGGSSTPSASPTSSSVSSSSSGVPATTMTVANLVALPSVTPVVPDPYEWMFTPGEASKDPKAASD